MSLQSETVNFIDCNILSDAHDTLKLNDFIRSRLDHFRSVFDDKKYVR